MTDWPTRATSLPPEDIRAISSMSGVRPDRVRLIAAFVEMHLQESGQEAKS